MTAHYINKQIEGGIYTFDLVFKTNAGKDSSRVIGISFAEFNVQKLEERVIEIARSIYPIDEETGELLYPIIEITIDHIEN